MQGAGQDYTPEDEPITHPTHSIIQVAGLALKVTASWEAATQGTETGPRGPKAYPQGAESGGAVGHG